MSKEWTTRRGRLLTLINRTAGLPTGSDIYRYMRCVFIFTFYNQSMSTDFKQFYHTINPTSTGKPEFEQAFK